MQSNRGLLVPGFASKHEGLFGSLPFHTHSNKSAALSVVRSLLLSAGGSEPVQVPPRVLAEGADASAG